MINKCVVLVSYVNIDRVHRFLSSTVKCCFVTGQDDAQNSIVFFYGFCFSDAVADNKMLVGCAVNFETLRSTKDQRLGSTEDVKIWVAQAVADNKRLKKDF